MATQVDFSGKTYCVLTGASQGIGRALATEVAKILEPSSVMLLLARNADQLAETASLCQAFCQGLEVKYESVDLSKATAQQMYDIIKNSIKGHNVLDFKTSIIFHNVGSLGNVSVKAEDIQDPEEMKTYYDLNVFNVITLNTQFLKIFEAIEPNVVIVNITSLCAIKPMTGMAFYCSGKAAREMYFKVLAEEKKNLRILNYSPGPVETAMIDYVIDKAVNEDLKQVFTDFKCLGTLLKPEMTAGKCVHVLIAGKYTSGDHVDYFEMQRKGLFLFLMNLAWKCRFSMPLLLSGTVAALGHAWMFQIRVHTVNRLHDNELRYYDELPDDDADLWDVESNESWETIVEEVAYV